VISEMDRATTWVMLNATGARAQAGPLDSDAQLALVTLDARGAITQRVIAGGNLLRFHEIDESARARKLPAGPLMMPAEFAK
jgi:hypothetical protein